MKNLWEVTAFEEVIAIAKKGDFIDAVAEKIRDDIEIGELTLLEKSIFTFYRREWERLPKLEKLELFLSEKDKQVEITKEKIRTFSKLLVFLIRKRLNVREDIINIRKGFKIVKVKVHWTREIKKSELSVFLRNMGVNTDKIAHS